MYLANYPELVKEDIYTNKVVDEKKVAKVWLDNYNNDIKLDEFDSEDFKESNELKEEEDPFKQFVNMKVKELAKQLKKESGFVYKLLSCTRPKIKQ